MPNEDVLKLYQHFTKTADVNRYHGNLSVLKKFMRMTDSELRETIALIQYEFKVEVYWFSDEDFIAILPK